MSKSPVAQEPPTATSPDGDTLVEEKTKKKKRSWELWTDRDKDAFFDAVITYGRDFVKIQEAIQNKTRDQIRHLFYRTSQMIREQLGQTQEYPQGVENKHVQDVYLLASYAEMRKYMSKKDSFLIKHPKFKASLSELVKEGQTRIIIKGKSQKVKRRRDLRVTEDGDDDPGGGIGREGIQSIIRQILLKQHSESLKNSDGGAAQFSNTTVNKVLEEIVAKRRTDAQKSENLELRYGGLNNQVSSTALDEDAEAARLVAKCDETVGLEQVLATQVTEHHTLPLKIPVELYPLDASTIARMQSLYQNPRIRVELPGDVLLIDLLQFLERKWHSEISFGGSHGFSQAPSLSDIPIPADETAAPKQWHWTPDEHCADTLQSAAGTLRDKKDRDKEARDSRERICPYPNFEFIGTLRSGGATLSDIKVVRQRDKERLQIVGRANEQYASNQTTIRWNRTLCKHTTMAEVALRIGAMGKPAAVRMHYSFNMVKPKSSPMSYFLNMSRIFTTDEKPSIDGLPASLQDAAPVERIVRSTTPLPVLQKARNFGGTPNPTKRTYTIKKKVETTEAAVNTDDQLLTYEAVYPPQCKNCARKAITLSASRVNREIEKISRSRNAPSAFTLRTSSNIPKKRPSIMKGLKVIRRSKTTGVNMPGSSAFHTTHQEANAEVRAALQVAGKRSSGLTEIFDSGPTDKYFRSSSVASTSELGQNGRLPSPAFETIDLTRNALHVQVRGGSSGREDQRASSSAFHPVISGNLRASSPTRSAFTAVANPQISTVVHLSPSKSSLLSSLTLPESIFQSPVKTTQPLPSSTLFNRNQNSAARQVEFFNISQNTESNTSLTTELINQLLPITNAISTQVPPDAECSTSPRFPR